MAFAGMDIGTSGCKLLVYDLNGNLLYQEEKRYVEQGTGGHRELNPVIVKAAILSVMEEAGRKCPVKIEAIAFASLGESIVCLDEKDDVICNSMLTGDSRGLAETKALIERFGRKELFDITGLPPNELYGLPKYIWLNENTGAIREAKAIMFYEDFAGYILTGKRVVSYFSAARSLAFNINKKEWSRELLALAGICPEQMSKPAEPGTAVGRILPEMAQKLHINPEMKVIVGGHDQTCAALGSGLRDMHMGECGMGTCEFMFMMLPEPYRNEYMIENDFTCIPYVLPEKYLTSLEVTTCGILKNWARDTLFLESRKACEARKEDFYLYMDKKAMDVDTEVLLLPQFGSRGNPDLTMDAAGTIAGLTIHTCEEELYRAFLEGMAFQMYLSYEKLLPLGVKMDNMVATGGGAASALALQIQADIFNMPVKTLENKEAGTLGCMIMAAFGAGAYTSIEEGILRTVKVAKEYKPNTRMHERYMKKYERYKNLYKRMYDFK